MGVIVRVHRPTLTSEEWGNRVEQIIKAAVEFYQENYNKQKGEQ